MMVVLGSIVAVAVVIDWYTDLDVNEGVPPKDAVARELESVPGNSTNPRVNDVAGDDCIVSASVSAIINEPIFLLHTTQYLLIEQMHVCELYHRRCDDSGRD